MAGDGRRGRRPAPPTFPTPPTRWSRWWRWSVELVESGRAYTTDDGVYLSVRSVADYGLLAHQSLDDMLAGGGDREVFGAGDKRDPADFALWKLAKPGEPSWPSPWGAGRPGWHTECVVMSLGLLGEGFDLHCGGLDLKFPHHENERAQAVALGKRFANHWMHHAFVVDASGEKMSKSLGNFENLLDLIDQVDPRSYRMVLLQAHYRSPVQVGHGAARRSGRAPSPGSTPWPGARRPGRRPSPTPPCSRRSSPAWTTTSTRRARWPSSSTPSPGPTPPLDAGDLALAGARGRGRPVRVPGRRAGAAGRRRGPGRHRRPGRGPRRRPRRQGLRRRRRRLRAALQAEGWVVESPCWWDHRPPTLSVDGPAATAAARNDVRSRLASAPSGRPSPSTSWASGSSCRSSPSTPSASAPARPRSGFLVSSFSVAQLVFSPLLGRLSDRIGRQAGHPAVAVRHRRRQRAHRRGRVGVDAVPGPHRRRRVGGERVRGAGRRHRRRPAGGARPPARPARRGLRRGLRARAGARRSGGAGGAARAVLRGRRHRLRQRPGGDQAAAGDVPAGGPAARRRRGRRARRGGGRAPAHPRPPGAGGVHRHRRLQRASRRRSPCSGSAGSASPRARCRWSSSASGCCWSSSRAAWCGRSTPGWGRWWRCGWRSESTAIGLLLLAATTTWLLLIPALALLVVGQGLATPTIATLVADRAHDARRGGALGFQQSAGALARIVGPAMGGILFEHVGVAAPYVVGAALVGVALLLATGPRRRRPGRRLAAPSYPLVT